MGANQSEQPRTVNLDNQNPTGIINVSAEVVERLKSGFLREKEKNAPVVVPAPKLPNEHQLFIPPPVVSQPSSPSNNNYEQSGIKYIEPTSYSFRRQEDLELQKNDAYWRKRLSQIEESLQKTITIMENEYFSTMKDVKKRFLATPTVKELSPCQALKVRLIACYRFNAGETLKCSDEVAAFANCVCEERLRKLDPQPIADEKTESTSVEGIPKTSDGENTNHSSPPTGG